MVSSGLLLPSTSAARFTTFLCHCSRRAHTVISIASEKTPKFSSSSISLPLRSSNDGPPSDAPVFTSSVRSPPLIFPPPHRHWSQHALLLNIVACAAAISASWLFLSAIPTLLAFKKAAESLEKLLDVAREELPDTMAAVRLSGMEMSDLTMELSDLGQEITQGVRNSTRAVRLAEGKLRQFTTTSPMGSRDTGAQKGEQPSIG